MIGTLICRNCDTVYEVSEGDVAKFKVSPVFTCTVCQTDLSPLMAGFVEGHSAEETTLTVDEFRIPEDQEVYDGLPMGESFDSAAARLRGQTAVEAKAPPDFSTTVRTPEIPLTQVPIAQTRPPASTLADTVRMSEAPLARREVTVPEPTPAAGEDPVQMALRLAAQATQQAAAMASKGPSARDVGDGVTGVALTWKPPQASAPIAGRGNGAAAASTEAGVVPEEPDNETTARGAAARAEPSETTEPTHPSPVSEMATPQVRDEATPLIPEERPARSTSRPQPTPALRSPPFPEPPPEEVTVRKASAPAPLAKPLLVRSGFGPASIGALGIRVVTHRPVVRPQSSNGRPLPPVVETQISQSNPIPRFEATRQSSAPSGVRAPAPAPVSDSVARPQPGAASAPGRAPNLLLYGGVGAAVMVAVLAVIFFVFHLGSRSGDAAATETPVGVESATPEDTAAFTAAPSATATIAEATPVAAPTHHVAPTTAPVRTGLAVATPLVTHPAGGTPTQVALVTPRPTTAVAATPRPTPTLTPQREASLHAIDEAARYARAGDSKHAMYTVYGARSRDPEYEPLSFLLWSYSASSGAGDTLKYANDYASGANGKFSPKPDHLKAVNEWLAGHKGNP